MFDDVGNKQMVGVVSVADRENLAEGNKNNMVRTLWVSSRSRAEDKAWRWGLGLRSSKGKKVL